MTQEPVLPPGRLIRITSSIWGSHLPPDARALVRESYDVLFGVRWYQVELLQRPASWGPYVVMHDEQFEPVD